LNPAARYSGIAARHPVIAIALALLAIFILAAAIANGRTLQAIAYLAAIALSVAAIDVILLKRPIPAKPTPVRHPQAELLIAFILFVVAFAWLWSHFVSNYTIPAPLLRLAAVSTIFNIPLAIALLMLRYSPAALGVRFRGFAPVPVVILCFGVLAAVFSPSSITIKEAAQEAGSIWGGLLMGFGEAALPEEFFRFVWQTRAGACLNNRAAGWLIASILWASLHLPKEYGDSHSLAASLTYVVSIIPLGLLWGYLTMRTRSILPSILLHGANLWGLQNV
jgi:membrane protease YdiL (CAAX protease family)